MPDTPNATPTNYNSAYTGPQIDASVGAVLDKEAVWDEAAARQPPTGGADGQILASANDMPVWTTPPFRPPMNLLDNWCFSGSMGFPVNQRGNTNYSTAGEFIFDRWKLLSGTVTLTSDGITLNGTIVQTLASKIGKPVTASALCSDGTMFTPSYNDANRTYTLSAAGLTIVAAKLELGDTQTIARQENGAWVLNEIPDYATELLKCQRYLHIADLDSPTAIVGFGIAISETSARILYYFPAEMVKVPSLQYTAGFSMRSGATGSIVTSELKLKPENSSRSLAFLEVTVDPDSARKATAGDVCYLFKSGGGSNGALIFSAES